MPNVCCGLIAPSATSATRARKTMMDFSASYNCVGMSFARVSICKCAVLTAPENP